MTHQGVREPPLFFSFQPDKQQMKIVSQPGLRCPPFGLLECMLQDFVLGKANARIIEIYRDQQTTAGRLGQPKECTQCSSIWKRKHLQLSEQKEYLERQCQNILMVYLPVFRHWELVSLKSKLPPSQTFCTYLDSMRDSDSMFFYLRIYEISTSPEATPLLPIFSSSSPECQRRKKL